MLRYHMAVITGDNSLKRAIKRLTTATGSTAEFARDAAEFTPSKRIDLAIFDARSELPDRRFFSQVPLTCRILYIVGGDEMTQRVPLLEDPRVTSLFCHDERFHDDEFISSATKALRGEIFGLQKYFPWGVTTFTMMVKNYEEKGRALEIMMRYAQMAGVRGPVRDRIQLVADELMMNALYHAPVDETGQERFRGMTLKQLAQLSEVSAVQVQYGCSGQYFGVAVRDAGGSLQRDRALDYLARARGGAQMEQKQSGAGLGLISVLHSVSKLVFNLAPGYSTEVIGLFDMELFARGKVGARSIHLFTAAAGASGEEAEAGEADQGAPARTRAAGGSVTWAWVLAGLLGATLAALATAYYFTRIEGPRRAPVVASQGPPTVAVTADPPDAAIEINGKAITAGVPVVVPPGTREVHIEVSHPGFATWTRTLSPGELGPVERIFVTLSRTE
jgi:hypothetical protein